MIHLYISSALRLGSEGKDEKSMFNKLIFFMLNSGLIQFTNPATKTS